MTAARPPVLVGGPEELFRLGPVEDEAGTFGASIPAGPWLADATGRVPPGALGVLVDDVLGLAVLAARPPGRWGVSTEITLDVVAPLPAAGTRLHAAARLAHADELTGFATGRITDDAGRLLAVAGQRGRHVPAPDVRLGSVAYEPLPGSEDVVRWLGATFVPGEPRVVPPLLVNPMGNLHGGVALCLSELAAHTALAADGVPAGTFVTASVHVTYVRPVPVGARVAYVTEVRHRGRGLAAVDVTGQVDTGGGPRVATLARVTLHPPVAGA